MGHEGLEPSANGLRVPVDSAEITEQAEKQLDRDDEEEQLATGVGRSGAMVDPIESALADALTRAATAGDFDAVKAIVAELEARRKARAGVVELDAERAKRGRR